MRIVCDKCSAAYAIEDRLITPRGVRGQCPRCKHRQTIRATASAAAPAEERPQTGSPTVEIDDSLLAPAPRSGIVIPRCSSCGKVLSDAFDEALGTCDECRARDDAAAEAPSPAASGVNRSDHLTGLAVPTLAPLELTEGPERKRPVVQVGSGAVRSAHRGPVEAEEGNRRRVAIGVGVSVVVLSAVAGGAWLMKARPGPKDNAAATDAVTGGVPAEIKAVLPRWELAFVDLTGDSAAALNRGQAKLAEDRPSSYDEAREEFQRALLLDPSSDAAIVGYVRALAAGQPARAAGPAWDEARSLIRAAEGRSGATPEESLAHAELLVMRSSDPVLLEEARRLAESVASGAGEGEVALKARAHVVIGRSWEASSAALAVKHFDDALSFVPGLGRALYFRALAHETAGDYVGALTDLHKRLEADPLHAEANAQLARLYLEAGRSDLARKVYETIRARRPSDLRARLSLAMIEFQVEGRTSSALTSLRELARELEHFEPADQVRILTQLAAAERSEGRTQAAIDAANKALGSVKDDAAAHLQLLLLALDRGQGSEAAKHLQAIRGRLPDPALERVLEGRLMLAERRWDDAVAAFQKAAGSEQWRVHALLLSGIAAASAERRDEAFRFLFDAARSDPTWGNPPHDLLRGMEGRILGLASGDTDVSPRLYEGLLRFHLGDFPGATQLFREAQDIDSRNALAFAWSALTALERKNLRAAQAAAGEATAYGRQEGIAHFAAGAVALASKQNEEAARLLREALRLEPGFLGAELRLAELDARSGSAEAARERLRGIIARSPGYLPARRLLFSLADVAGAGEEGR